MTNHADHGRARHMRVDEELDLLQVYTQRPMVAHTYVAHRESVMTLRDAITQAYAISDDNRASQHVNRRLDGTYYTSDWYNGDSTVVTFDAGKSIYVHPNVCAGTVFNHKCERDYKHDAHMI